MTMLQQASIEVLTYLYEGYKEYPGSMFSIDEICEKHGISAVEMGQYLKQQGLIRNGQTQMADYVCEISREGIWQVDRGYFEKIASDVMSAAGILGDWVGINEVTNIGAGTKTQDAAKFLEGTGYFEVQYQAQDNFVKLNLNGRNFYQTNKADFN